MNQLYDYEKLLTSREATKMLNINTRTLNSLAKKGVIAYHVYDRRKYFSYYQISAFMIELLNVPVVRYREDPQA
jgi:hypothetical protein